MTQREVGGLLGFAGSSTIDNQFCPFCFRSGSQADKAVCLLCFSVVRQKRQASGSGQTDRETYRRTDRQTDCGWLSHSVSEFVCNFGLFLMKLDNGHRGKEQSGLTAK